MVVRQAAHVVAWFGYYDCRITSRRDIVVHITPFIFALSAMLLVAVLLIGVDVKGAQRWLDLPGFPRFQPSELMKLALPAMVAWWLTRQKLPRSYLS